MTSTDPLTLALIIPTQLTAMLAIGVALISLNRPKDPPAHV